MKRFILFDLDNTLTESRSKLDSEMRELLEKLLITKSVGIVCGVSTAQLLIQLDGIMSPNLYLFPANSSELLHFNGGWETLNKIELSSKEKYKITLALLHASIGMSIDWTHSYGKVIADKGGQMTFAALGEEAPLELKKNWDPNHLRRLRMKEKLDKRLPKFEITVGGYTSIDISRVSKGYCISLIKKQLGYELQDITFIADALFKGGNDYPVKQTGVECVEVSGPEDTKRVIRNIIGGNK